MTARADATSMSFRPDAFKQFARDKTTVIDRLLGYSPQSEAVPGIHRELLQFMRREILANMHLSFAGQLFDLVGDAPAFREQVLAAHHNMPGAAAIAYHAGKSRHLDFDPVSCSLSERENVPPRIPPKELSNVIRSLSPDCMKIEPQWASGGAAKVRRWGRTVFTTPPASWNYAAIAPFDIRRFRSIVTGIGSRSQYPMLRARRCCRCSIPIAMCCRMKSRWPKGPELATTTSSIETMVAIRFCCATAKARGRPRWEFV